MRSFPLLWIPLLPLLGALFNLTLGHRSRRRTVHLVACGTVLGALIIALVAIFGHLWPMASLPSDGEAPRLVDHVYDWISAGALQVQFGLMCDALTAVMLIVITFVGFLIHVYSTGYMDHDPDYARFFGYLNLFTGAMLILVLADNLALMFVGWEGVGLCSYLLIGFWYDKDGTQRWGLANASAGRKAFIVNRIGDFAFIIGMLVLLSATRTLSFAGMSAQVSALSTTIPVLGWGYFPVAAVAGLLLFIGATGKSAQIPLYVWLPDAMAGPTPVSALIHAATMVTAGVYMVARMNFLYMLAPWVMGLVALIGAVTALYAASIAFAQNDIKKVLAYSTVSQLGYMFMGVGVGAFSAGIFHLFTHAFFKACLFLCAGAVIHALGNEQDIRNMGGLRSRLRITHLTFFVSTWAIAGLPLFSGFFSKDEVLWKAIATGNPSFGPQWLPLTIYVLGLAAAVGTAFYMFRLYALTFLGSCRLSPEAQANIHPPGNAMRVPLVALALGAAVLGVLGLPEVFGVPFEAHHVNFFHHWLDPVVSQGTTIAQTVGVDHVKANAWASSHLLEAGLMLLSVLLATAGSLLAYLVYRRGPSAWVHRFVQAWMRSYRLIVNKYWIDELYDLIVVRPYKGLSWVLFKVADRGAIDICGVHGVAWTVDTVGRVARRLQNGNLQHYVVALVLGIVGVVYWVSVPSSDFVVKPGPQVQVGERVTFDATPDGAGEQRKLQYRWDFDGDGRWDHPAGGDAWSASPTVSHVFTKPRPYRVILKVRDPQWRTSRQQAHTIDVVAPRSEVGAKVGREVR